MNVNVEDKCPLCEDGKLTGYSSDVDVSYYSLTFNGRSYENVPLYTDILENANCTKCGSIYRITRRTDEGRYSDGWKCLDYFS